MKESKVQIQMLGGMKLIDGDRSISHFRSRKVATLLAYLALYSGRHHRRDVLTELLWPSLDPETANNRFRVTLNRIREVLRTLNLPTDEILQTDRTYVQFLPINLTTDVSEFKELVTKAKCLPLSPQPMPELPILESAANIYTGPLLGGYDEEWSLPERQQLEDTYLGVLRRLFSELFRQRQYEQALSYAQRALAVDPLREETHLDIIRTYLAMGRSMTARRQYADLEQLLKSHLSIMPSKTARLLLQQIESKEGNVADNIADGKSPDTPPDLSFVTSSETHKGLTHRQIPSSLTTFFGRDRESDELSQRLTDKAERCITLTGAGGVGKTRLAMEAVSRVQSTFNGEVFWVSLEALKKPEEMLIAIATSLSLKPAPNREPIDGLVDILCRRPPLLMILDNMEQLLDDAGHTVSIIHDLLSRVPNLSLLITSRRRLGLSLERERIILPLESPAPPPILTHEGLEAIMSRPSVQMFVDRARHTATNFSNSRRNLLVVAELCHHLDGLPLAIELTAAWTRTLTVSQIVSHLHQRFDLFESPDYDTPSRHKTLRHALQWSYQLLPPELQWFFRQLSNFPGSFTVTTVEAILKEHRTISYLHQLQMYSLIVGEEYGEEMRFRLLETLRTFGQSLVSDEERITFRRQHVTYFANWLYGPNSNKTSDSVTDLDAVAAEYLNLRFALEWCLADDSHNGTGIQLGIALFPYWRIRGSFSEGRQFTVELLKLPQLKEDNKAKYWLLWFAGYVTNFQGDYHTAIQLLEECLDMARLLGEDRLLISPLHELGSVTAMLKGAMASRPIFQKCLAICRKYNSSSIPICLVNLGEVELTLGNIEDAHNYFKEALTISQTNNYQTGVGISLFSIGRYHFCRCDYHAALKAYEQTKDVMQQLNNRDGMGMILIYTGEAMIYIEDTLSNDHSLTEAKKITCKGLAILLEAGQRPRMCYALRTLAFLWQEKDPPLAVRLLAAADAFEQQFPYGEKSTDHPALRPALHEKLGETQFQKHYAIGQTQTLEAVADEVLNR